ncbi:hypothetical protein BDZ85DRAFT_257899 [Elsinoe ampelina]|uniref:Arrestin-like N-terminal domain-containing protein n=1 Tax=Elsinoe ampelina TaxID=302913 RepID=A0A6A6GJL6_9PEZI|nr:hypothetical protein BDZ85DRAFT_257899 [Elsinoe ampelina]
MGLIKVDLGVQPSSHIFTAGDTIRGKVTYKIQPQAGQEKLDDVQLVFRGKMTTKISRSNGNNRKTNREEIYLFKNVTTLFRGPFDMSPQTLEWPFEVSFPVSSSWDRDKHGDDPKYAPPGEIPLPPSFSVSIGGAEAVVDYMLKVKINEGSLTRSREEVIPLRFNPLSPSPVPDPVLQLARLPITSWSSRDLRPERHDFKQKMRHVFTSDPSLKTPEIRFTSKLGIPSRLCPGQNAPLAFSLTYTRSNDVDPVAPTLILEHVRVVIKTNTIFRARSTFSDWDKEEQQEKAAVSYRCNIPMPLDGSDVHPVADFGLHSFKTTPSSPPMVAARALPPDFITWTINHSHYLKATILIRHKETDKLFEIKSERLRFEYYPPHDRSGWETPGEKSGGDAQLPSYGEAGGSTAPAYEEGQAGSSSAAPPPPTYDGPTGGYVAEKQAGMEMGSKAA